MVTVRAASRLTPRIVAYQVKRLARNKIAPRFASRYEQLVGRNASRLPIPSSSHRIPLELANFIGAFYRHADDEMRDAEVGRFTILGRAVDFGSIDEIDWAYRLPDENDHHLWRMKLTQLEVVHSLIASGQTSHQRTALALLECFDSARDFSSPDVFSNGWAPYGASHRLLATLSGLAIAVHRGSIADDLRSYLESFARLDAGFLWRNIEHDLQNNHTERNLAALCLYHLAAESISIRRAKVLDREVDRIVRSTVLADGMQIERSAMYQGLTVMSLRIFAQCPFLSRSTRELARTRAVAATGAWSFLTHSDGEIALFNDSWMGEVPATASILGSADVEIPSDLPAAGYYRVVGGGISGIIDVGEIGPRWNPGHGHADFLALEVDAHGSRLIVDPGTSQYSTGPQRAHERSAASHNGPRYIGVEPVEYSGCFKVGKLNRAEPLSDAELSKLSTDVVGGRVGTAVGACSRVVCALPSGGLLIVDRWTAVQHAGETSILIPATWTLERSDLAVLRVSGPDWDTTLAVYEGSAGSIGEATWSRRYLSKEPAHSVTLTPAAAPDGGQRLVWGVGVVESSEVQGIRNKL